MPRFIGYDLRALALVVLMGCGASSEQTGASSRPEVPAASSEQAGASRPEVPATSSEAPGAPVLVRLVVLDTNAGSPEHLPDDRSLLHGANAVLAPVAACRAEAGSRAHWVEIEWHVADAGKILKTIAHPVFIPPQGRPPAIDDATLRCIERRAAAPPFTAAKGRPTVRALALIGFDLPELGNDEAARDVRFLPEPDGYCRLDQDCPAGKICEEPPRVPCPRAGEAGAPAPAAVEVGSKSSSVRATPMTST